MKSRKTLLVYLVCTLLTTSFTPALQAESREVLVQINGTDTMPIVALREIIVYPPLRFKNTRQEHFYWRTVRDVKKTLPYARLIAHEMQFTDSVLLTLPDKKAQRAYMNKYERQLFKKYEKAFRGMTARQGFMLMKLVDRQCDQTSYEVIKYYKGGFVAFFWQGIARLFGNNLKVEFDAEMSDEDKIVERIITLVEAGQL